MRSVDVEASEKQIWQKSFYFGVSIIGWKHSMLTKIFNSLGSFTPKFLQSVATKQYSVKYQPKQAIDEKMKLQSLSPISTGNVKWKEY